MEKQVKRIVLDGQSEDILQVVGEIHEILHEVKENEHERNHAEVLSKDVQWKYKQKAKRSLKIMRATSMQKLNLLTSKKNYMSASCVAKKSAGYALMP